MEAFYQALDNLFGKLFKGGDVTAWRDWGKDYISVVMLALIAVAFVLILTIIIAAIVGAKNKKKRKALQEQNDKLSSVEPLRDSGELRAEIRSEMEPIIREQVDREYRERYAKEETKAKETKKEQPKEQPKEQTKEQPKEDKSTEELRSMIVDIHSTTQDLKEQIETLTAENTALKNEVAAQNEQAAEPEKPVKAAAKKPAKKPEPVVEENDDDYGEDEYDDEYGDENSALQVSVQYDRMKMNWVVMRSDSTRTYRRCDTKQEALPLAKDLAKRLHARLVVHKKDGKFQKI